MALPEILRKAVQRQIDELGLQVYQRKHDMLNMLRNTESKNSLYETLIAFYKIDEATAKKICENVHGVVEHSISRMEEAMYEKKDLEIALAREEARTEGV